MESYFNIESVWEDESLFEVKASASNGEFSGVATCYTNRSGQEIVDRHGEIVEIVDRRTLEIVLVL